MPPQPFEFTAGDVVSGVAVKKISDSANGLFAGSGGPKPPSALGTAVLGMRVGGKVSLCKLPLHLEVLTLGNACIPFHTTAKCTLEFPCVTMSMCILQRSVIVPPEVGYGATGLQEIPPNGTFEMRVEVLQVG